VVEKDASRIKYLSPDEAVDYGLIDKVLFPEELRVQVNYIKLPL
jgi:ATP-dependent protease ClpP protease subunit